MVVKKLERRQDIVRKYATPAFVNRHMEQENKKLRQEQDKALNKHAESEKRVGVSLSGQDLFH